MDVFAPGEDDKFVEGAGDKFVEGAGDKFVEVLVTSLFKSAGDKGVE